MAYTGPVTKVFTMDSLVALPLPSLHEMTEWDRATIAGGIPSLDLMERAGNGIFQEVIAFRSRAQLSGQVLILCGPGNNGGDGLVVARLLRSHGTSCRVIVAGAARYSADFLSNARRVIESGGEVAVLGPPEVSSVWGGVPIDRAECERMVASSDTIIDSLLGTGQREAPSGEIRALVEIVERSATRGRVISVDIPTGVNGESGAVFSPGIKADLTVAIQFMKRGLAQYPARERCGDVVAVDIGIKPSTKAAFSLLSEECVVLPRREASAHKGDFGHVTVIGGSHSMPGAPVLTATAALRMGAGWVSLARPVEGVCIPEVMIAPVGSRSGSFNEGHAPAVLQAIQKSSAVVIGPGLGTDQGVLSFLESFFSDQRSIGPFIVVDADALNCIAGSPDIATEFARRRVVLTPHPGEAGRLLGCTSAEVQSDRFAAALELSERYRAVVVLKGAASIVFGDHQGYVCPFGTPYLAAPGSGDVLGGIIGTLGGQGLSPVEAACRGVVIHARAGETAHRERGGYLLASDLIEAFGKVIRFQ